MLDALRKLIALDSPIRIFYHYLRGLIAFTVYGNPAQDMVVIGITGTKGKSTVTNIVAKGLELSGKKVFMFSTIQYAIAGEWHENTMKMTSVDPFVLQRLLVQAKRAGCEYAVIEVSSHAIFYNRIYGLDFDVAAFTNLSQDHLDLHHTMEHYRDTKLRLFSGLVTGKRKKGIKKVSVVNIDDPASDKFLEATTDILYTYGSLSNAQIQAKDIVTSATGTSFGVRMPANQFHIETGLCGEFNVKNILAAIGVLVSQKVDVETIKKTLASIDTLPGRLERVPTDFPITVFVDYAHTEESLRAVLETIRSFSGIGRIITVF